MSYMNTMLKLRNIHTYYGQVHALKSISLHLSAGEIVTLIGANGAGKTTILNSISAVTPIKGGEIAFSEAPIHALTPERVVSLGISQVPEGRQVFKPLSVEDNLELGAYLRYRQREPKAEIQKDKQEIFTLFPRLEERRRQLAGTLSGGEQQMLPIGRAMMTRPQLLLLDEPSMGLAPMLVEKIFEIIQEINQTGTTIMLVEQNAQMALSIASRGYVLETGEVVLQGPATELAANPEVRKAYLGE